MTKKPVVEASVFKTYTKGQKDTNADSNQLRKKTDNKELKRGNNKDPEYCSFCDKKGHNKDGCFKIIGYPDWWPNKTKQGKGKVKGSYVETRTSPILGLSRDQY